MGSCIVLKLVSPQSVYFQVAPLLMPLSDCYRAEVLPEEQLVLEVPKLERRESNDLIENLEKYVKL